MASYFSSLSARERVLLGFALIVGIILVGYLYLWEPKLNQLAQLRDKQVPESEQTLAWVKQALARAQAQPGTGKEKIIEGPLLTVIEQTAELAKVSENIRRMQPSEAQSVKIWMDEVKFDQWLIWIDYLRKQNVFVERISIVNKSPGVVDIRLTLARR